jgi:hypothetical protein
MVHLLSILFHPLFFLKNLSSMAFAFLIKPDKRIPGEPLKSIVRKGLVRFRHLVDALSLLDGTAPVVRSIENFACQLLPHCFFGPLFRMKNQPANPQSQSS